MLGANGITIQVIEEGDNYVVEESVAYVVEVYDFTVAADVIPETLITTKGDVIVGAGNADPRRLGVGANDQVLMADSTQTFGVKWGTPSLSGGIVQLTNKSGGDVAVGDVLIWDIANASSFKTTTVAKDGRACGVAVETIANNATGKVAVGGCIQTVNVQGNVAIGSTLVTSTTSKRAMTFGGARAFGMIGYALTSYGGGGAGTVSALIVPNFDQYGAQVLVEGYAYPGGGAASTSVGPFTASLQCGTNANRLVLCLTYNTSYTGYAAPVTPTLGGNSMTPLGSYFTYDANRDHTYLVAYQLFYYSNPATGSLTLSTGTQTGGDANGFMVQCAAVALSGVNLSSSFRTTTRGVLTTSTPSLACSDAVSGDLIVGGFFVAGDGSPSYYATSRGSGQVQQGSGGGTYAGNRNDAWAEWNTKVASSSTDTMSFTLAGSTKLVVVNLPVVPA